MVILQTLVKPIILLNELVVLDMLNIQFLELTVIKVEFNQMYCQLFNGFNYTTHKHAEVYVNRPNNK